MNIYKYWLEALPDLPRWDKVAVLKRFGSAEGFYRASDAEVREFEEQVGRTVLRHRQDFGFNSAKALKEELAQKSMHYVQYGEPGYPSALTHIADPPAGIFYKGRLPDENRPAAAIVGARMCTEYGRNLSRQIASRLSKAGYDIISGMAIGIDSAAHAGALSENGITYAILGCGCDICYPKSGRSLYRNMQEKGGVLSEYRPGGEPLAYRFPERNRIISALSSIVIVVEAKARSGSLITADFAIDQGKEVYAVPGRFGDAASYGCNWLISQGAGILYDIDRFLSDVSDLPIHDNAPKRKQIQPLEKEESLVYSCLNLFPKNIMTLSEECRMDLIDLTLVLHQLLEKELIRESGRNCYMRTDLAQEARGV